MVERQKEKYGWEFLFLGANIDAIEVAGRFGIAPDRAVKYECDSEGIAVNYKALSEAVSRVREAECCATAALGGDWKEEIEADYKKRHRGEIVSIFIKER